jgi:general stress protein 26
MTGVSDDVSERLRVRALIRRCGVVVLMTMDDQGRHMGRPMLPLFLENDADMYFLTHANSRKVVQIASRPQVDVVISSDNRYFVLAGHAQASRDQALIRRVWHPTYRAWFPDGQGDREATVLRVAIERVDYWEPPSSRIARLAQAIKAVVTRRAVDTPMKTLAGL